MRRLASEKHSRGGNNARWDLQDSSLYLQNQKFPIRAPRVRDVDLNHKVPLEA